MSTYLVHVKPSGYSFSVNPGETVLAAALRQGYEFPRDCRHALCGTCKGRLLAGQVSYTNPHILGVSADERELGYALFCSAYPQTDLVIEIAGVKGPAELPIKRLTYQVQQVNLLADNIYQVWLKPPAGDRLEHYAGQYLEILHADTSPRPFSIANAPRQDGLIELHIKHWPTNPYTTQLLAELRQQSHLRIAGPLGQCIYKQHPILPTILLAGGTGFAPLKAIIEQATQAGLRHPIYLYWGVRSRADLYLQDQIAQWVERYPDFHFIPVLSAPDIKDNWTGSTGLVTDAVLSEHPNLANYHVYASGPTEMVYAALHRFQEHGLNRAFMYSDIFDYQPL